MNVYVIVLCSCCKIYKVKKASLVAIFNLAATAVFLAQFCEWTMQITN